MADVSNTHSETETVGFNKLDDSSVNTSMRRGPKKALTIGIFDEELDDEKGESVDAFYVAMATMTVTLSGFSNARLKNDLQDKIQIMSGEISASLTLNTTHVLAAHANTPKVKIARERNIPVVSVEWVQNLYKVCSERMNPYIHASQPEFQDFKFPLFHKLRFVFSKKFDADSKKFYEKLVTDHGGKVCRYLKNVPSDANFFICAEPEDTPWYRFAKTNAISCVSLAWISDSVGRNKLSNISEYEVRGTLNGFGDTFEFENGINIPLHEKRDIHQLNQELDPDGVLGFDAVDSEVFEPAPDEEAKASTNDGECINNEAPQDDDDSFNSNVTMSTDDGENLNSTAVELETSDFDCGDLSSDPAAA